ncbi:MAG: HPr family phosphocarrier protein [Pseudohongiella sp.]|nr:HPr family phosphocarrier protein [Pseudohongiella sp.]MDP1758151.1 HPr family phosphocarrier protein [Pseudohongiella sp.]MDP2285683.1 HPr family phosphocarrier protein [Pseudohongiella sp.]MDP2380573.1 HPr family phosphocarrier protein [Pseudohongiella sp.]MDP3515859.1 HPr family phosphocarrier protein [Pseudohongiella sp.]
MIESSITICNKAGLHARAASRLVSVATQFQSSVKIGNEKLVDGRSILSLMMLAAGKGTTLRIVVDGEDEQHALDAIQFLVNNRFDEGE